ncbi:MAG: hypothetical protein WDN72_09735 [Alphaproteobacteria bacterium]
MIPELGQFCLCLALMVALLQGVLPLMQRVASPHPLMFVAKPCAAVGFLLTTGAFGALIWSLCGVRFLGAQRGGEFEFAEAADLQNHRRVGEP